jgi:hypothetical protein
MTTQLIQSVSIPGQGMTCDGNDHYFTFRLGDALGGGSWPSPLPSSITILSCSYSVKTDDPNAQSCVGLNGAGGDMLTPVLLGQAFGKYDAPAGCGRQFLSTDELHFHVLAAAGKYANINAAIEFSVP